MKSYKILYVAKHSSGGNDDEGAITFALKSLGQQVTTMSEQLGSRRAVTISRQYDFVLCHKWSDLNAMSNLDCPLFFWNFDLVRCPEDKTLDKRNRTRSIWFNTITAASIAGFVTDGTSIPLSSQRKLFHLPQGCDSRICPPIPITEVEDEMDYKNDILFTGISKGGGERREAFVRMMKDTYGPRFTHVEKGIYREELRELISQHKIVVCPDSPVYQTYCSNRVYNALGFGAFVLHPKCWYLEQEYKDQVDLVFYENWNHLHERIDYYLNNWHARRVIQALGHQTTVDKYTYKHRVEKMLTTITEIIGES